MTQAELGAFLRRVDREVRRLGVRDQLRVQEVLASDLANDRDELRAALASALAQGEEEWERIAERFDACVARQGRQGEAGRGPAGPDLLAALTAPAARRRRRWPRAAGLLLSLMAIGGLWWRLHRPPPGPSPPPVKADERHERAEPPKEDVVVTEREKERRTPVSWQPPPFPVPARLWLGLGGAAALLSLLGLHLVLLPGGAGRRREAEAEAARARLSEAELVAEDPLRPVYRVDAGLPFPTSVVDDSALYLGRLFQPQAGPGLDVPATVRRTLDAGGQLTLVPEQRRAARELLVLVDRERGDHPWLWGIQRLLSAWERRGVVFLRYRFRHMPAYLWPQGEGDPVALGDLGRRHEGAALVIFSRRLTVHGEDREAGWLGELSAWPVRAWVDPDPRPPRERGAEVEADVRRLLSAGLLRFPYSAEGLVALGRHLCADGQGAGAPEWPALPGGQEVRRQVRLLATVAAMVPDPTWEQIDGLRQLLGKDAGRLTGPWYVQRLLAFLREDLGERDPEQDGRALFLSKAAEDRLIKEQRRREGEEGQAGPMEHSVRKRLLDEIAGDKDGAPGEAGALWRLRRDLARARHQAVLEPGRAAELLGPFFGSAVHFEAQEDLATETGRQGHRWAGVRALLDGAGAIKLGELLRGWRWPALATPGVALLGLWGAGWGAGLVARLAGTGWQPRAEVIWPRTVEVVRREKPKLVPQVPEVPVVDDSWKKATPYRARMVKIPKGRFDMGSPEGEAGHQKDEALHPVRISRDFLMGATEVTQAQYSKVMKTNPSGAKGNTLPVENVTWVDAATYCNRLSVQENLKTCYIIKGDKVDWPERQGCAGYRLPTEAEWEYAAGARKKTIYAGSNNLDEVGWYDKNSSGQTHPVGGKKANAFGLSDMSGNVWEWVWDWYGDYPAGSVADPIGPKSGQIRVYRGGSWIYGAVNARVAYRYYDHPGYRDGVLGFRLARSLP